MKRDLCSALFVMATALAAPAATWFVATDGKPENDGSRAKPWPSVEHALSQVGAGHTIIVQPGIYRGPIQIPRVEYNLCTPKTSRQGTNNITGNPMFVDVGKGLFWLRADSPARGKGSPAHVPETDFWARSRSENQPVDLGAMPFIPELATADARQRFEFGWAYYRHGSGGTIPDLWLLPTRTP